ncbi:MAG: dTMP kinase [Desulfobacula sp.]|nr:dTMP kinase [Desulfobacula sp.]
MNNQKKGRFIVFEGIDGSGKSTQIKMLSDRLSKTGIQSYSTFEPTDGPIGTLIRQMLIGDLATDQRTIASLFAADRTDHLVNKKNGVCHKTDQGQVVLCDRYYFSSYAYHAQYIDMAWVINANALNAQLLRPDLTVFIDVDPDNCFERIKKRIKQKGGSLEMYEKIDIMQNVRSNYFKAFEAVRKSETIAIIDGGQSMENVAQSVWEQVKELFESEK